MLHSVVGRARPCKIGASLPNRSLPHVRSQQPLVSQSATVKTGAPVLRSAHGCIFAPVMHVAGRVMDWRLQHDGFVVRDIKVSGGHVRLWDAPGRGKGPCVVFIHGLGGSSCEYRDTLVWLQSRCRRVIAVDMPSHGGSSAIGRDTRVPKHGRRRVVDAFVARINHALDAVLNEPATLVGHSLGGYAAMRYALEGGRRRHVLGLGLVSPDGAPWTRQELADDAAMFAVTRYASAGDIAARTYPKHPMRAALITPFIYARFATAEMQYLNHSDVKQPALTPTQLGALPRRIRLVVGKAERFDPEHNLVYFRAHMPASMEIRRPDTGHGDIVNAHPDVLAALQDFII